MARVFMEGFEHGNYPAYATTLTRSGYFGGLLYMSQVSSTAIGMGDTTTVRNTFTNYSFRINTTDINGRLCYMYKVLPSTYTEVYTRCYVNMYSVVGVTKPTPGGDIFSLNTASAPSVRNGIASIKSTTAGNYTVYVGSTLKYTTLRTYYDQWVCLETRLKISSTVGRFDFKLDGVTLYASPDLNTGASNVASIMFGGGDVTAVNTGTTFYVDDIAINDTSGSVNNSWIGYGAIVALKPKAAGYYMQWSNVGAGVTSNYMAVDEVPKDDDTTYAWANTVGQIDTYDIETLVSDKGIDASANVSAISTNISVRYDTTGGNIAPLLRYSNVDSEGTSVVVGAAYNDENKCQVYDLSPFSNAAWTVTEVDGLEIGAVFKG